ncbi:putative ABC transporter permease [Roseburia hominis]
MSYTGYELLWLFFAYSFAGWVLETLFAAGRQKQFVNRGLINGPVCVIYGTAAVLMTIGLSGLGGTWIFLGGVIYATALEWSAGHLIAHFYHERWWNYSEMKWNLDGYIAAPMSLLWGMLGYISVKWGNPLLTAMYRLIPGLIREILLWALVVILAVDALATCILLIGKSGRMDRWEAVDSQFANVAARLGKWISGNVEARIHKAYQTIERIEEEEKEGTFAEGCGFYKVVMLFFVGAFLGDITETIFCRVTAGVWMSRSSVVWGPFSIVWGLAIASVTAMLYKYKDRSDSFLFWIGTLLGGAYEYFCSVFTELVFGTVFWDYSDIPFNLGGRINLLYCFFWGIAAVVWFKRLYPIVSRAIEKLPVLWGKLLTWGLIVFMSCNIVVSCMALVRYDERGRGIEAKSGWQEWVDMHYDDEKMDRIYPNAKTVE